MNKQKLFGCNEPLFGNSSQPDGSPQNPDSAMKLTIDVTQLSLADWLAISKAKDNSPLWGFYGWLENSNTDWKSLTRRDVEAIALSIEKPASFVWRELEDR